MPPRPQGLRRPVGERRYRQVFLLAVEGTQTEPQYFSHLQRMSVSIQVKCLPKKKGNSPRQALAQIKGYIQSSKLMTGDEAWLVVDRDQWEPEHLDELHKWTKGKSNCHLALSNPSFEYWLLLHFENGDGISGPQAQKERLRRHLPHYDKDVPASKVTGAAVNAAVARAKNRDKPPCRDWPHNQWQTTVYRLVEKIILASSNANASAP